MLIGIRRHAGEARLMIAGRSSSQRFSAASASTPPSLAYVVFALFPIYWTLKISVTPERLLYSEGITFWPSRMTLQNFVTVLEATDFPRYFKNSVIVSARRRHLVTSLPRLPVMPCRASPSAARLALALMLLTQMFPLVMVIPPIFRVMGRSASSTA
jgi:multiple sugar transport system permease protein